MNNQIEIPDNFFGARISYSLPNVYKPYIISDRLVHNYIIITPTDIGQTYLCGLFQSLIFRNTVLKDFISSLSNYITQVPQLLYDENSEKYTPAPAIHLHYAQLNELDMLLISKIKNKKISQFIKDMYNYNLQSSLSTTTGRYIYTINGSLIISAIIAKYSTKWLNLAKTLNYDYDILQPFDIRLEERNSDTLNTEKDKTTYTDNNDIYAFNTGTVPTPTDKTDGEKNREYKRTIIDERSYTRKGNIGNKSKSQLMEEEREKAKFIIVDTILDDVSKLLTRGSWA